MNINPSHSTAATPPLLLFQTPKKLTPGDFLAHKLVCWYGVWRSQLPQYEDSTFRVINCGEDRVVIRQKKREALKSDVVAREILHLQGPEQKDARPANPFDEAQKTRSFFLHLLSRIEDFEMAKLCEQANHPEVVSHAKILELVSQCKGKVRYYLENGVMQKKAGFIDFLKLIQALKEIIQGYNHPEGQKFLHVFRGYEELVELQKKLPKKSQSKASQWEKVRTLVRSGLFDKNIEKTAESAQIIGLHPIPAMPVRQTIVNLYPTLDAIHMLASNARESGRWLMTRTSLMTFKELCQSIKTSCNQLRDTILKWDDYYLLTIKDNSKDKSQAWMADIAYRFLPSEKMPKGVLSCEHNGTEKDLYRHLLESGSDNFIMFDDCSYSGMQAKRYLDALEQHLFFHNVNRIYDSMLKIWDRPKNIYLIFGAFPEGIDWRDTQEGLKRWNVHVHFVTANHPDSITALMEKDKLPLLMREQIKDIVKKYPHSPLLVTEWKRPDYVSTPMFVTEGTVFLEFRRNEQGELNHENECCHMIDFDGMQPITDIKAPYNIPPTQRPSPAPTPPQTQQTVQGSQPTEKPKPNAREAKPAKSDKPPQKPRLQKVQKPPRNNAFAKLFSFLTRPFRWLYKRIFG